MKKRTKKNIEILRWDLNRNTVIMVHGSLDHNYRPVCFDVNYFIILFSILCTVKRSEGLYRRLTEV